MSEITTRIEAYRQAAGDQSRGPGWPELRDWLANHKYAAVQRYDSGTATENAMGGVEWDNPHVDGSWDDVVRAKDTGKLTREEYYEMTEQIEATNPPRRYS